MPSIKIINSKPCTILPLENLSSLWNGIKIQNGFEYSVSHDSNYINLIIQSNCTPWIFPETSCNTFYQGLWQRDLFEIFLFDKETGLYQELEFAPNGAWWSWAYPAPRTWLIGFQKPQVQVVKESIMMGWKISASIKISSLCINFNSKNLYGNICGVIGENPRNYFSLVELPGSKVNFHQPDRFIKVIT
ncbi:MAG: hypothetical protein SGJ02_09230 [bacterium]|nr:hypothetical protein [bacterium]